MTAPAWTATIRLAASDVLNENDRRHWTRKSPLVRTIRQIAHQTAVVTRAPHLQRARLAVTLAYPDRKRRDRHNYTPTIKPIVDGLIDAGVLPDDDDTHLEGPVLKVADETTTRRMGQRVYEFHLALYPLPERTAS